MKCCVESSLGHYAFLKQLWSPLLQFSISVSTDMRHHRVRLMFQDTPVRNGKKPRVEQGVQVVLDPVHSVRLLDWWHPQYPFSPKA